MCRLRGYFVREYRDFRAWKRRFHIGERVLTHVVLLHVRQLGVGVFDSLGINGNKLGGQIPFEFLCPLILEGFCDLFFQLYDNLLFRSRPGRLETSRSRTRGRTLLAKANGSSCNQAETTKNELSFHSGFLGHSDSVVESFLDSWISPLPGLFHTLGDDGGSGGGFGADAIEGGAGDAPDRIGKNSGGITLAHTS